MLSGDTNGKIRGCWFLNNISSQINRCCLKNRSTQWNNCSYLSLASCRLNSGWTFLPRFYLFCIVCYSLVKASLRHDQIIFSSHRVMSKRMLEVSTHENSVYPWKLEFSLKCFPCSWWICIWATQENYLNIHFDFFFFFFFFTGGNGYKASVILFLT